MAVVALKSSAITDHTAVPRVPVSPSKGADCKLVEVAGLVTPAADDTAASTYRFCRVPSNACIRGVFISAADATTAGTMDIGVYATKQDGTIGAVKDADLFASALAMTGGPYNNSDQTNESGEYTYAEQVKPLWEVLGETVDPHVDYEIVGTVVSTFSGGPTSILLRVQYVK